MTSAFDAATAVDPRGDGRYAVDVHPAWSIGGRANGGYLLAVLTRAVLAEVGGADGDPAAGAGVPVAVTGAFAAPTPFGAAEVRVEVVRRGRTTSVARARLVAADGTDCIEALVTVGALPAGEPLVPGPAVPDLPDRRDCVPLVTEGPGFATPMMGVVRERVDPACLGFVAGTPSGRGVMQGYVSFADRRPMDPLGLLLAVDCLPPATFDLDGLVLGWVPTLQLSAFVRALPAEGPLVVRTLARSVGGGAVDETTDVWDATGRLVAVGHQLAMVRRT